MPLKTYIPLVPHKCQGIESALGQIMAWRPFGTTPLSKPMLGYYQSIGPLGTNFSEIITKMQKVSFTKMHLKISSAKWRQICLGLSVLTSCDVRNIACVVKHLKLSVFAFGSKFQWCVFFGVWWTITQRWSGNGLAPTCKYQKWRNNVLQATFQMHFLQRNSLYFDSNFIEIWRLQLTVRYYPSVDGFVHKSQQKGHFNTVTNWSFLLY